MDDPSWRTPHSNPSRVPTEPLTKPEPAASHARGLLLDVESPVEPVRPADRRSEPAGDAGGGDIQRVGGRRRIRTEIVLPIAAALFLIAALGKPWPNPTAGPRTPAANSPSAGYSALSLDQAPSTPSDVQVGVPGYLAQGWSGVDWSILQVMDPHLDWGFAAVTMPSLAVGLATPNAASSATDWSPTDSGPSMAALPVPSGHSVYGLAVTWPADVQVTSVTFVYLGGPEYPPYLPPPGFPPFTEVSPLPAQSVAGGSAGASSAGTGNPLASGTFWIPPSSESSSLSVGTVQSAWQLMPWSWPNGTYRVAITSGGQVTTIRLNLQQSA